jgi:hypothetical protein
MNQPSLLDHPPAPAIRAQRTTSKGIGVGDIVEVDRKGRRFHALVTGIEQEDAGRSYVLALRPLDGRTTYRSATVRDVVTVWRKVR